MLKKNILIVVLSTLLFWCVGCTKQQNVRNIAVFVPGIIDNSPVYEMLVKGVTSVVDSYNKNVKEAEQVSLFVMEAGTNQAEWSSQIISLVSTGKYEVIISSNPSLPDLVEPITKQFTKQKFILLDATKEGNPNIATVCYNQKEQAYLSGYVGSLMSKNHKMALIAAQEYPVMNDIIYPYFVKGAQEAFPKTNVEFRIVGNWYDATKAAEISDAVIGSGADVLLPICGGASQGVINSAVNKGVYICWFDDNGFAKAPGTVVSSTVMMQEKMSALITEDYLNGNTKWGTAGMVGVKEGFVDFVQDDENYKNTVPENVQEKMKNLVDSLKNGTFVIN